MEGRGRTKNSGRQFEFGAVHNVFAEWDQLGLDAVFLQLGVEPVRHLHDVGAAFDFAADTVGALRINYWEISGMESGVEPGDSDSLCETLNERVGVGVDEFEDLLGCRHGG